MGSSPGFVSNPCDCGPIQTRFRYASGCISLRLATKINSPAHSPKGTPSGLVVRRQLDALRLLVSVRFQVLFHSPSRGTFHLSLTVLVHYRSSNVFSLGEWTPQIPTGLACPVVLRYLTRASQFSLTGLSPSMVKLSRSYSANRLVFNSHMSDPTTPSVQARTVWAFPRSLATTSGIISFPLGT